MNTEEKKPLLSKEEFVELIRFIKETDEKFNNLIEAMEALSPGFFIDFFPQLSYVDRIIMLLNLIFHEPEPKDSLIEYFIYTLNCGKDKFAKEGITCDGKTYDLSSPELLYDAMVELYFKNPAPKSDDKQ